MSDPSNRDARERAERTQAYLAALVDSADDAILSKDLDGVIQSWNAGAERMFAYTADEMIGRPSRGFAPVAFTEGTVVVDLMNGDPAKLVWHGVFRRSQDSAPKLAKRLPEEAGKLLKDYPPKPK